MKHPVQTVISASRRTDIPAFYMDWFMAQIHRGFFEVTNPYNRKVTVVPATCETIHTIVFWSKNFGPFLDGRFGEKLITRGYQLFFNFTINSESSLLEPNVPPLVERLDQLDDLCRRFNAKAVTWRFDPICFFKTGSEKTENNLKDFESIAQRASRRGVERCVTSFMDHYAKVQKRTASIPGLSFIDLNSDEQKNIVCRMEKMLAAVHMDLFLCCEKDVLSMLPPDSGVSKSACIPNRLLVEMFGGSLSFRKDAGQRIKDGCGCMVSVDIGSYSGHPCFHNCLFCYANPVNPPVSRENRIDPDTYGLSP